MDETKTQESWDRLQILRNYSGLSQAEVGRKTGISQKKMSRLENDQPLDRFSLAALAKFYGVSAIWIETGEGAIPERNQVRAKTRNLKMEDSEEEVIMVDLYQAVVPTKLAPKIWKREDARVGKLPIPGELYQAHFSRYPRDEMGIWRNEGDAMAPTIGNGDLVLSLMDETYRGDGIYLIQNFESIIVKRLQRMVDHKLMILSDNPAYKTETIRPEEHPHFHIIGRLLWVSHVLGF